MDILVMLDRQLTFIKRFYNMAAEPFESVLRKIEAHEDPYVLRGDPEDYDGPEYQAEWGEADDSLRILGQCALGLVPKALQDYLRVLLCARPKWSLRGFLQRYRLIRAEAGLRCTVAS